VILMRCCLVTRRKEVSQKSQICMEKFRRALDDCGLQDLGFVGDIFTWRNHHHNVAGYIRERLDRAVACGEWRRANPLVRVINGDPRHSDHRPVIVDTGDKEDRWCKNRGMGC